MYRVLAVFVLLFAIQTSGDLAAIQTTQPEAGAYWCPMHPNIRGNAGDVCRICHMPLVLAPARNYTPYHLSIETSPRAPRPGRRTRIRLTVHDPDTNAKVTAFETVHERLFHLFILSQDLEYFTHVHPSLQPDGSFAYDAVFPAGGPYRLIGDFIPTGGAPQLLQQTVVTSGYSGPLIPGAKLTEDLSDKIVDTVRVKLSMPSPIGGREQLLTFEFFDAASGAPISDLEPYLGAAGHLLLVSANLESVAHSHPVADMSTGLGPTIVFQALFPRAGMYRFWVQVQRRGRVLNAPFTVAVRSRGQIGN
jgi:hypothetical protein